MANSIRKLALGASALSACLAGFCFVIVPTQVFQKKFESLLPSLLSNAGRFVIVFGILAILSFIFAEVFSKNWELGSAPGKRVPSLVPKPKWYLSLTAVLVSVILIRALLGLSSPMDFDEHRKTAQLTETNYTGVLDPMIAENHPLPTLISYYLYKLLGMSPEIVRLGSVMLCLILCLFLRQMGILCFSNFTGLLILGHLTLSEVVLWYAHSMRGYMALMLFTLVPFYILLLTTRKRSLGHETNLFWLSVCGVSAAFTHTFAAVFITLLLVSYLFWLSFNRSEITVDEKEKGRTYLLLLVAILLIYMPIGYGQFKFLNDNAWIMKQYNHPEHFQPHRLLALLGLTAFWEIKLHVLLAVSLLSFRIYHGEKLHRDFLTLSLAAVLGFYAFTYVVLETHLNTRYLLPSLVIYLAWLGESIEAIASKPIQKAVMGVAFGLLFLLPIKDAKAIYNSHALIGKDFVDFIRRTQKEIGPEKGKCLTYSGEHYLVWFSKTIYFHELNKERCMVSYHLHFQDLEKRDERSTPLSLPTNEPYELLFESALAQLYKKERVQPSSTL